MSAPPPTTPRQILWCQCGKPVTSDLCGDCQLKADAQLRGLKDALLYSPVIFFAGWVILQIGDAASRRAGV